MTLLDTEVNKNYTVRRVIADGNVARRLNDMGFVRGSAVSICGKAPFNGAVLTILRGTLVALRSDIALKIEVEARYEF